MFGVIDLSEHDNCINFLFLCLKVYLHRRKFQQTKPNFVAFLNLVKIKRNTEYKMTESKGKLRRILRNGPLILRHPNFSVLFFCLFALHRSYHHSYIFNLCGELCVSVVRAFLLSASACFVFVFCPLFCLFVWVDYSLFPFLEKKKKNLCLG